MNPVSTAKDAIIAELLGDVGELHDQIKILPNELEKSVGRFVRDTLPSEANVIMNKAALTAIGLMASQVGEIAQQIAGDTAASQRYKSFWLAAAGVLVCAVVFGGAGYVLRMSTDDMAIRAASDKVIKANNRANSATESAEKKADIEITNIRKTAGWVGTPEGMLAKKFFDSGTGVNAAECNGKKWEIKTDKTGQKWCIPKTRPFFGWDTETEYVWKIP